MPTIFTNKYNLPESIVRAIQLDTHRQDGEISVTQLIDAPQIRMLKKQNTIEVDVMDMIHAVMGTAVHTVFERADIRWANARKLIEATGVMETLAHEVNDERIKKAAAYLENLANTHFAGAFNENIMTEKTLVITVDGMTISGTFDRYVRDAKKLQDYKNTSTYEYIFPESRKKRWMQFNIYAAMLREHGYEVEVAELVYIFRDWSRSEARKINTDYPPTPIFQDAKVPLLSQEEVMGYLKKRVALHRAAEAGERVDCTGKERWASPDTFAVMVPGLKRAKKLAPTKDLAEAWIKSEGHKFKDPYVETRPGEDRRCAEFCPVRDFCQQRKKRLELLKSQSE